MKIYLSVFWMGIVGLCLVFGWNLSESLRTREWKITFMLFIFLVFFASLWFYLSLAS